jgi:pSer/pThr/pTyr-binding forkhead associated (FHA) protein
MDGDEEIDDFILGSETVIGRGTTNEIVLSDRSVASRHARLTCGSPSTLEALAADHPTLLNGNPVLPGSPVPVHSGDRITLGNLTLRFEEKTA